MSGELTADPAERRRAVCKALTRVVRKSKLSADVDPKSFFMMLNANYAVLYRDEFFDLTPLWEALSAQQSADVLTGLFLRFAETLEQQGLRVGLPVQIADLTLEQQRLHLEAFDYRPPDTDGEVEAITDELESLHDDDAAAPLLELHSGDLRPIIAVETRREIVHAVIQAIKAAPVGQVVNTSQLAYLVDNNFASLCDGSNFNVEPVLQGLRDLGNVTDRDLYLATALLRESLKAHDIALQHQPLLISDPEKREILLDYQKAQEKAKRDAVLAVTHTIDTPPGPPPKGGTTDTAPMPRAEARRTQLRRLGLGQADRRTIQRIRAGVLAFLLAAIAIPTYLLRPDRPLPTGPYEASIPLQTAELQRGIFVGRLDEERWWPLDLEARRKRLRRFEAIIKEQGFSPDLQVRDSKNRLVVTSVGHGRLRGAPFLMRGRADGTLIARPDYSDASEKPRVAPTKVDDDEDDQKPSDEEAGDKDTSPAPEATDNQKEQDEPASRREAGE